MTSIQSYFSIETERSVLGGLMLDNSDWLKVVALIKPEDFYDEKHQIIFRAMEKLKNENRVFDILILIEELKERNTLEQAGGELYLFEIAKNTPSVKNIIAYTEIIRQKSLECKTLLCAEKLKQDPQKNLPSVYVELGQIQLATSSQQSNISYRCFSDIEAKSVNWLWKEYIAYGKVTMIAGNPDVGKSQTTAYIAAIVTTGGVWFDGTSCGAKKNVVVLSAEDEPEDTIRPRLEAAGADLDCVFTLDAIVDKDKQNCRILNLKTDLNQLNNVLNEIQNVGVIIIDPITAYLGNTDSHKNAEVRALLAPLNELASKHGIAIICVSHLNKNVQSQAIMRVMGSLAFVAAARATFLVVQDPVDDHRRLFLPMKNNISKNKTGFSFTIESYQLPSGIETSRVVWSNEVVTATVDEVMSLQQNFEGHGALEDAKEFLLQILADEQVPVQQIQVEAKNAGHAWATIKRAKKELQILANKTGLKEGWVWVLPPKGLRTSEDAHTKDVSAFAENEHLRQNSSPSLEK